MNEVVERYLGREWVCEYCGHKHAVPIRRIVTVPEAERLASDVIADLCGRVKRILLIADGNTWDVLGKVTAEGLRGRFPMTECILASESGRVLAEEKYGPEILRAGEDCDVFVTVGAGTVTDLGKYAAHQRRIPWVSVPTAPSMNAYTSGVAALIMNGMKVALSTAPATAVLVNPAVNAQAPVSLVQAGFADSLAKSFANADWRIASMLTGERYCPLPGRLTDEIEGATMARGARLLDGDMEAVRRLMDALSLGGIAMVVAGKSSPASGGEHLVSHFLDMYTCGQAREPFAYHGTQVGVGITVAARIYDSLRQLTVADVERRLAATRCDYERDIEAAGRRFPRAGGLLRKEFEGKRKSLVSLRRNLAARWDEVRQDVLSGVHTAEKITAVLKSAQCAVSFSEMGVPEDLGREAVRLARYLRDRLTVLDIAGELGLLDEI